MTQVLYARVPDGLKGALDEYAAEAGATLTAAVVDLLGRGLAAVADEASIAELQRRLAEESSRRRELEAEVRGTRIELGALDTLRRRSENKVATCRGCSHDVSGYDLLVTTRCPDCGASLADLASEVSTASGGDQRELLLLLGAIGALVGAAWIASKV